MASEFFIRSDGSSPCPWVLPPVGGPSPCPCASRAGELCGPSPSPCPLGDRGCAGVVVVAEEGWAGGGGLSMEACRAMLVPPITATPITAET